MHEAYRDGTRIEVGMFGAFLANVSGWFDRQYLVAYWSPTFLGFGIVLCLGIPFGYAEPLGPIIAPTKTQQLTLEQVLLGVGSLIVVTVFAYVLQALTPTVVRAYEGYWPNWIGPVEKGLSRWQQAKCDANRKTLREIDEKRDDQGNIPPDELSNYQRRYRTDYYACPQSGMTPMRPTHLGNILSAAEDYPRWVYHLDSVLWWPRLAPLFPNAFRDQINATLTPMLALLNLATMFCVVGFGEGAVLALGGVTGMGSLRQPWWVPVVLVVAGVALAYCAYRAATTQALGYADTIRVGFDLYRHELLKKLDVELPTDLVAERKLWSQLSRRIYINPSDLPESTGTTRIDRGMNFRYVEDNDFKASATSSEADVPSA